ncbi:hypothetical protein ACFL41_02635 [Gemmatimonadota bacterium]
MALELSPLRLSYYADGQVQHEGEAVDYLSYYSASQVQVDRISGVINFFPDRDPTGALTVHYSNYGDTPSLFRLRFTGSENYIDDVLDPGEGAVASLNPALSLRIQNGNCEATLPLTLLLTDSSTGLEKPLSSSTRSVDVMFDFPAEIPWLVSSDVDLDTTGLSHQNDYRFRRNDWFPLDIRLGYASIGPAMSIIQSRHRIEIDSTAVNTIEVVVAVTNQGPEALNADSVQLTSTFTSNRFTGHGSGFSEADYAGRVKRITWRHEIPVRIEPHAIYSTRYYLIPAEGLVDTSLPPTYALMENTIIGNSALSLADHPVKTKEIIHHDRSDSTVVRDTGAVRVLPPPSRPVKRHPRRRIPRRRIPPG